MNLFLVFSFLIFSFLKNNPILLKISESMPEIITIFFRLNKLRVLYNINVYRSKIPLQQNSLLEKIIIQGFVGALIQRHAQKCSRKQKKCLATMNFKIIVKKLITPFNCKGKITV